MPVKAIVLSGSGLLFPAHLGFLQAVNQQDWFSNITCISGTSGGAFSSFLWLLCHQLDNSGKAFNDACDDILTHGTEEMLSKVDIGLLITRFGMMSFEPFESHFVDILRIYGKCDGKNGRPMPYMTFQELFDYCGKTLVIVASDPKNNTAKYFSHLTTPDVKVLNAVRFSMTVTGIFAMENNKSIDPFFKSKYHPFEWRYVDGALCDTFPMNYVAEIMKIDESEILGNFIHTTVDFDGKSILSLFKSQLSWIFSSRILPNKPNTIVVPFQPHENMFSRFTTQQRIDLLNRAKDYTLGKIKELNV